MKEIVDMTQAGVKLVWKNLNGTSRLTADNVLQVAVYLLTLLVVLVFLANVIGIIILLRI